MIILIYKELFSIMDKYYDNYNFSFYFIFYFQN